MKAFIDIHSIPRDASRGYILEVDLDYPEEIHDQHADYPLAPEKVKVTYDMLSPYQKKILQGKLKEPEKYESLPKLIPNLQNKRNYIVHYRNLQLYLSLGMKLVKVHRILSFNQSPWLKEYIDFNTHKRTLATNEFQKAFFKLMIIRCLEKQWRMYVNDAISILLTMMNGNSKI